MSSPKQFWCVRCGSRNHKSIDCSSTKTYQPTADDLAYEASFTQAAPAPAVKDPEPAMAPEQVTGTYPHRFPEYFPVEVCAMENRLCFPDQKSMGEWLRKTLGSSKREWCCQACGGWHYESKPKGPSGASNGTERDSKIPSYSKGFRRKMRGSMFANAEPIYRRESAEVDLPEQEKPVPEKKALPRAPKKGKIATDLSLFK